MGISGLLQFIKDAGEPVNVKKYRGQSVAVDTYCWLHKGAFSCAEKLARGEATDQYVCYCMKFVDMLLSFSVKPILVFDGRNLPSKREVEKARRERREANLQKGRQLLREGKLSEARDCFTRSVNITPGMAHNLIKAARARGVDCVVAPYEADAQLAFLSKCGLAQAVITEDSDLLAFGCRKVILKMDKQGNGLEIDQANLGRCRSLGNVFTEEKFRHMCILSGCDYLPSLHGIGLGKACKLLRLAKDPDILKVIRKMGQYLKMNLVVPEEYIQGFVRANNTFLYQLVFDPLTRKVVPLNPYHEHVDPAALSYAGVHLGDDRGFQMALGNIDLDSMDKIDDFCPDRAATQPSKARSRSWNDSPAPPHFSIWSRNTKPTDEAPPPPAVAAAATSPHRPASTRGKQRVIHMDAVRMPCRELQVKRPREDSSVSDQDVLQQYSSCQKRSRSNRLPAAPELRAASQPRARNRFATLLQRRNQEAGEDAAAAATRSRFFNSPSCEAPKEPSEEDRAPSGRLAGEDPCSPSDHSDGPEIPSVDTPSPSPPATASQGLRLFRWSGEPPSPSPSSSEPKCSSGLAALQHFHYRKESFCSSSSKTELTEPPEPPPSQDSAYCSQSQSQSQPTPCPAPSPSSRQDEAAHETPSGQSSEPEQSPTHAEDTPRKLTLSAKVPGLLKPSTGVPAAKGQALGPARVSGLRRRPASSGRKAPNNENNPGVQATISSLWENFRFKKDSQKMSACSKAEAVSPTKAQLVK